MHPIQEPVMLHRKELNAALNLRDGETNRRRRLQEAELGCETATVKKASRWILGADRRREIMDPISSIEKAADLAAPSTAHSLGRENIVIFYEK